MIDFTPFQQFFTHMGVSWFDDQLVSRCMEKLSDASNRDVLRWRECLQQLGKFPDGAVRVNEGRLCIENETASLDDALRESLTEKLKALSPWRKGPIYLHGIHIDTEWRSDFKWARVLPHISPLRGRVVLDVGCGNGYHGFRMAADGAAAVLGVDPFVLSNMQFWAMTGFASQQKVCVLPIGVDDVPAVECFHTVFSMGLLYHRKSPIDHLFQLKSVLKSGGEMVLETLVIDGEEGTVLVPEDRYAMMRNVWFIPSVPSLERWVRRAGFVDLRVVDVTPTTIEEQRRTEWMTFDSLPDFLHPGDSSRTVEGYPAPVRAVLIARKP